MSAVPPAGSGLAGESPRAGRAPASAADRLAASRLRLRAALMDIAHPPQRPSSFEGLRGLKAQLLDRIRAVPGADVLIQSIEGWWAQHPLHAVGIVANDAARRFILPAARTNPLAWIVGSLLVGALLVLSKPWKWLLRPALFIGLVPQLAAHALQRVPIESWIRVLDSILPARASKDGGPAGQASGLPKQS